MQLGLGVSQVVKFNFFSSNKPTFSLELLLIWCFSIIASSSHTKSNMFVSCLLERLPEVTQGHPNICLVTRGYPGLPNFFQVTRGYPLVTFFRFGLLRGNLLTSRNRWSVAFFAHFSLAIWNWLGNQRDSESALWMLFNSDVVTRRVQLFKKSTSVTR